MSPSAKQDRHSTKVYTFLCPKISCTCPVHKNVYRTENAYSPGKRRICAVHVQDRKVYTTGQEYVQTGHVCTLNTSKTLLPVATFVYTTKQYDVCVGNTKQSRYSYKYVRKCIFYYKINPITTNDCRFEILNRSSKYCFEIQIVLPKSICIIENICEISKTFIAMYFNFLFLVSTQQKFEQINWLQHRAFPHTQASCQSAQIVPGGSCQRKRNGHSRFSVTFLTKLRRRD